MKNPFKKQKPSVDNIVSSFQKTVDQLNDAADHHHVEAAKNHELAVQAAQAKEQHLKEKERAQIVAGKIAKLLA